MKKFSRLTFSLLFCAVTLCACAHIQKPPPDSKTALLKRAELAWQSKLKKDWETFYELTTVDYRAKVSLATFLKAQKIDLVSYEIVDAVITDATNATVTVNYITRHMGIDFNFTMNTDWRFENNRWHQVVLSAMQLFERQSPAAVPSNQDKPGDQ